MMKKKEERRHPSCRGCHCGDHLIDEKHQILSLMAIATCWCCPSLLHLCNVIGVVWVNAIEDALYLSKLGTLSLFVWVNGVWDRESKEKGKCIFYIRMICGLKCSCVL